jgi:ABC-2 type transport system ATP-binding protein
VIEVEGLTKRYGTTVAVDDVTFTVRPGLVTGFLGPNGAGKSTTMRLILGLDAPSSGTARINGKPLAAHDRPMAQVGALLEARAIHGGRAARDPRRGGAAPGGGGRARVDAVIDLVGLGQVADRRTRSFSLGMGQRLGIATALLGDPETLILDEPVNGLDPDGVRWIRTLLRGLADEGRTVFLSSHLMSEMALTADHLIVIGRGRLLRDMPVRDLIDEAAQPAIRVRSPQAGELARLTADAGWPTRTLDAETLEVGAGSTDEVGRLAGREGITILELTRLDASLEEAYMALTEGEIEFGDRPGPVAAGAAT